MKEAYENANYSTSLDIPTQLAGRYPYYIEIDNSKVYVNSSDGRISVNSSLYNMPQHFNMNVVGRVEGKNKLVIFSNKSDYVYRFDFGTNTSEDSEGYTKVTNECTYPGTWHEGNHEYRTPINIYNPLLGSTLLDYQILLQIDENNFDYSLANRNGSDLRFYDDSGDPLYYWIERWDPDNEKTSRVWVNISQLEPGWSKIYIYHGNPSAPPESSGEKTFIFFDDFTGSLSSWAQYNRTSNGEIKIIEGDKLLIANGSAVTYNGLYIVPSTNPVVIETKAYAPLVSAREASMFARSSGIDPPYNNGYVFSSANFPTGGDNLTLLYYNGGWFNATPSDGMSPLGSSWYRLRYIINGQEDCISRYYYDNFAIDDLYAREIGLLDDGYFGLCVKSSAYNTRGIYDWVYVRKFAGKTDLTSGGREDFEPVAYVDGTQSKNFYWTDTNNVESGSLYSSGTEYDFISNAADNSPAVFEITNVPEGIYSLTFLVGHPQNTVDNVKITVDGGINPVSQKIVSCDSYKKVLISNVEVDANETLEITFDDEDVSGDYWAVSKMTIEKGDRSINLEGIVR